MKTKTIWEENINLEDWQDFLKEEYPEVTDEFKQYELCWEINEMYLEDERMNLDKILDGEIICIANLGLWNGRKNAHKTLGNNISNILFSQMNGNCHWYSDGKNICCTESHHDGTNYYTYRVVKGETHERQLDNIEKLFSKPLNSYRIGYYTKSLVPEVNAVYGW